jgi:hypothetical protein
VVKFADYLAMLPKLFPLKKKLCYEPDIIAVPDKESI